MYLKGLFINYATLRGEGGGLPWYYANAFEVEYRAVTKAR
jgi:hypothetical protein